MKTIDKHIEYLLLDNDCVIVPGLGGFVAHRVKSRFDKHDNMFLPPYRTLGFNPLLTMNDSLLAQAYTDTFDISHPEAMSRIEKEVENIQKQLDNQGQFEFNGLGTLIKDKEQKLIFEPYESGIITPEYYGLGSFEAFRQNDIEEEMPIEYENTRLVSINTDNYGQRKISISFKAIRHAALAAMFLATITLIIFSVSKNGLSSGQVKSSVISNIFDSATPTIISRPHVDPAPWTIVMASHIPQNNAQLFKTQLQKKGFEETFVYNNKGTVKVLYGHFKTSADAFNTLHSLQGHPEFKSAWVMELEK